MGHMPPINLSKGNAINLDKGLDRIYVGLSWSGAGGRNVDLDLSISCITPQEKLLQNEWFVFYNNLKSPGEVVCHSGDARVGGVGGNDDDESVTITLSRIPPPVAKVLLIASIHQGGTTFAEVQNAKLRLVDLNTNNETHQVNLNRFNNTRCVVFAEIFRRSPTDWGINVVCGDVQELGNLVSRIQVD